MRALMSLEVWALEVATISASSVELATAFSNAVFSSSACLAAASSGASSLLRLALGHGLDTFNGGLVGRVQSFDVFLLGLDETVDVEVGQAVGAGQFGEVVGEFGGIEVGHHLGHVEVHKGVHIGVHQVSPVNAVASRHL